MYNGRHEVKWGRVYKNRRDCNIEEIVEFFFPFSKMINDMIKKKMKKNESTHTEPLNKTHDMLTA